MLGYANNIPLFSPFVKGFNKVFYELFVNSANFPPLFSVSTDLFHKHFSQPSFSRYFIPITLPSRTKKRSFNFSAEYSTAPFFFMPSPYIS